MCEQCSYDFKCMVGLWAYGGFEGRHVDRWLSSRAGWSADVLRGGTKSFCSLKNKLTYKENN